jgi:hypothetical protein
VEEQNYENTKKCTYPRKHKSVERSFLDFRTIKVTDDFFYSKIVLLFSQSKNTTIAGFGE